jgi:hypothetical protein
MHKIFRFIYLNTYSFLLLICGIIVFAIPLFIVSKILIIPQIFFTLFLLNSAIKLFATWNDKKRMYKVLILKNKKQFRADSFKDFMQAPCGRLLTKAVLKDLRLKEKYKELLVYKKTFFVSLKKNLKTQKTVIYINEDFLRK